MDAAGRLVVRKARRCRLGLLDVGRDVGKVDVRAGRILDIHDGTVACGTAVDQTDAGAGLEEAQLRFEVASKGGILERGEDAQGRDVGHADNLAGNNQAAVGFVDEVDAHTDLAEVAAEELARLAGRELDGEITGTGRQLAAV